MEKNHNTEPELATDKTEYRISRKNIVLVFILLFAVSASMLLLKKESGKFPFKRKEKIAVKRVNPIKNPQITLYNFSGEERPNSAKFGMTRRSGTRAHQGVDIFALPGTDVYAVLDGKIIDMYVDKRGYGLTLYLEVNPDDVEKLKRIDYDSEESSGERLYGENYVIGSKIKYIRYAHLSSAEVEIGDSVKAGQVIAKTGSTGNATRTRGPHLHFEMAFEMKGKGLTNRVNPEMYFFIKSREEMTSAERKIQEEASLREWPEEKGYDAGYRESSVFPVTEPGAKTEGSQEVKTERKRKSRR